MKKRENNKVNSALKGVAYAGVVLGGASVVQNADVVFAAETQLRNNDEFVVQLEENGSEDAASESASLKLTSENESLAAASTSASTSLSVMNSEITSESVSAALSLSAIKSQENSLSLSASSLSEAVSGSASESMSMANSEYAAASSEEASASISLSAVASEFNESGYNDPYLEKLLKEIETAKSEVEAARLNAIKNNQGADHSENGNNYYGYADKLANLLIQYAFYQEGYVGEITYSDWCHDGYVNNNVIVTYIDVNTNETKTAYFDYVTADKDGNVL
ncbi:MAG: hypothetical protein Q4F11_09770, partial [Eubacteriales bacterium]|nr:hypothetical protein [Eubacteriales bacterium]